MKKLQPFVYAALSALAFIFSLFFLIPWLVFIAFVPLLLSIGGATVRQILFRVGVFGLVFSMFSFSWMLDSTSLFTGNYVYAIFAVIISTCLMVVLYAALFFLFKKTTGGGLSIRNIFLLAALTGLFEFAWDQILETLPWFSFHFGQPLLGNLYTIQLAEVGGIYILTFFTVIINGLIAYSIKERSFNKLILPVLVLFFGSNVVLYHFRNVPPTRDSEVSVNLLTVNIDPTVRWEDEGDVIVQSLLSLNRRATENPADINVWPEAVVPWTYQADDDFANAILNESMKSGAMTILGMSRSAYGAKSVYNSAYVFNQDKNIVGRYDKVYPLKILEAPVFGKTLPTIGDSDFMVEAGEEAVVINTEKGFLGIFICNEATIARAARNLVANGAEYMVNISNDGWFKNSYLAKHHFYYNRLRSVETRKDIAVNSNCGFSGVTKASGDFMMMEQSDLPIVREVILTKNKYRTIFSLFPYIFLLSMFILFLTLKTLKS